MSVMAVNHEVERGSKLPYVPWKSFWTFIEDLRARGSTPQVIDNTVWGPTRSGQVRSQLGIALRFLGLMDEDKSATGQLDELVSADDPVPILRSIIEDRYKSVVALGLDNATVRQVDLALSELGAGTGDTLRKTRVFFLQGADFAGIPLGPYLKKAEGGSPPRPSGTRKRAKRAVAAPERKTSQSGDDYSIELGSGGRLDVRLSVKFWDLDEGDMQFVLALRKMLREYSGGKRTPVTDPGPTEDPDPVS